MLEEKEAGRKPIPSELLKERREMAVSLKLAGLATETIRQRLNMLSRSKGWSEVTLRTVERDIASYYRENRALKFEDIQHALALRESHVARIELIIENMFQHVNEHDKADDWARGEKVKALKSLSQMLKDYTELQGWDLSKQNISKVIVNNNLIKGRNHLEMFDRASEDLDELDDDLRDTLLKAIDQIAEEKFKKQEIEKNDEKVS